MSELETTLSKLQEASHYSEIFGLPGSKVKVELHIKRIYRRLARKVHPDKYNSTTEKELAAEAFKLLGLFYERAKKAAEAGTYGPAPKLTIITRKDSFEVGVRLAAGEIADLYEASSASSSNSLILKIGRSGRDNDLLKAEARALKLLRANADEELWPFYPELLDSFSYRDEKGITRHINALAKLEGFYTLEEVRQAYPNGINPLDAVWIWRRLLWLLGGAHDLGILHGAVLPSHIMIQPEKHGVILVDWCYSQTKEEATYLPLSAVSGQYLNWYPKEVTEKRVPSNGTDVYLAVRSMLYLLGASSVEELPTQVPRAMRAFFRGCMQENHLARPQEAWALLEEFDELLENLGQPYYPRKFHPFSVPRV